MYMYVLVDDQSSRREIIYYYTKLYKMIKKPNLPTRNKGVSRFQGQFITHVKYEKQKFMEFLEAVYHPF